MTSGGTRGRSGPAPDPNALRRDRKDDAAWVTLPIEGYVGDVPEFPLTKIAIYDVYVVDKKRIKELNVEATEQRWQDELDLWAELWEKPQAYQWSKLGLELQVASYVRAFHDSVAAGAPASMKTAVLRMSAEIGLSLPGMHQLRWKFSTDELAARREEVAPRVSVRRSSMKDRLRAVNGSD